MDYLTMFRNWLSDPALLPEDLAELEGLKDAKEIEDRFYKSLSFGTAGMRGIIGIGENRMNIYTVRRATCGLARMLQKKSGAGQAGVCISYDSRKMSREFAAETAKVLCAHGIRTYLYSDLRPVPMLSYAVRSLGCAAGVMITASHNPAEYNGYKVYAGHGGQMEPEDSQVVMDEISLVKGLEIPLADLDDAYNCGLLSDVPAWVDDEYYGRVCSLIKRPEVFDQVRGDFMIVYTPLHGSAAVPVQTVFSRAGVPGVYIVQDQQSPDGDFPTVSSPNPEDPEALAMAIALSECCGADLCLGTDPDGDRMGAAIRCGNDSFMTLTGNQIGCLMLEYILNAKRENGTLPENGAVIKSIVTTELADKIAASYNVATHSVLTGFKYIAGKIGEFEHLENFEFLFGFEESYGYMAGSFVRDKDAVQACLLTAEMAAWYKLRGMTPYDGLEELYGKYGYYLDKVASIHKEGKKGAEQISAIMQRMRGDKPSELGGFKVLKIRDYLSETTTDIRTGNTEPTGLPQSDVLYYELDGGMKFVARPSGTEPKIKFYFCVNAKTRQEAEGLLISLQQSVENKYLAK